MKKIIILLLVVCTGLVQASCQSGSGSNIENTKPDTSKEPPSASVDTDALFETMLPGPLLPSDEIPDEPICTDYTSQGLLRICYHNDSQALLKLQVIKDDNSIAYNLKGDGSIEDFSLQYGDGEYTARIMQNIENDKYFAVESKTFSVTIDDETAVYLNSIQNVDWDYEKESIKAVRLIVSDTLTGELRDLYFSCTEDLYQYIIGHIEYDHNKIVSLSFDYLPDIDQTFTDNKGICYDYASLFAAMLRSIRIPAKLVKGYASTSPDEYHAWNEVYVDGRWIVIDTTKDAGKNVPIQKNIEDYIKVYEY